MPNNVLTPIGGNIFAPTRNSQQVWTAVAALTNGGYIQVWTDDSNYDGSGRAIVGRLFDNAGNPLTPEFRIDASGIFNGEGSFSTQTFPTVTALADGGFVVGWQSFHDTANSYGIYAQRYTASGVLANVDGTAAAPGANSMFHVDTLFGPAEQSGVSVQARADGGFTFVWATAADAVTNPQNFDVYARTFSPTGVAATEVRLNTNLVSQQLAPDVALLPDGTGVAVWQSLNTATNTWDIFARRLDATGAVTGGEILVTNTANNQFGVSIAALDNDGDGQRDDGFIVVWASENQDSANSYGVYGRLFTTSFAPLGAEFRINESGNVLDPLSGNQYHPSVVSLTDGSFIVSWDGDANGVFARRFSARPADLVAGVPTATTGAVQISSGPGFFGNSFNPYHGLDGQSYGFRAEYGGHDSIAQLSNGDVVSVFGGNNDVFARLITTSLNTAPTNAAPDAVDDSIIVAENQVSVLHVLGNDTDPTNDTLTIRSVTQPTVGGTVAITDNGTTITFTPTPNFSQPVTFTYTIWDGKVARPGIDTATVNLTITGNNISPPTLLATSVNPTFHPADQSVDLFSNVSATTDGGDSIDGITLTVTNVLNGATESLRIDGQYIALATGNTTTGGGLMVAVSVTNGTASLTITPPGGYTPGSLATLIDNLEYRNLSASPGSVRRVVTITSISDNVGPNDTAVLNLSSTASPATVSEIVSVATSGVQGDSQSFTVQQQGFSSDGSVSTTGQFVTFYSIATNLVSGDTNGQQDIFLRDRYTGVTTLISGTAATPANNFSDFPTISGDGRYVAFHSGATNIVAGATATNIFVRDTQTGTTVIASVADDESQQQGGGASDGEISVDGHNVVFTSGSFNLIGAGVDTNNVSDVFVRNLVANSTVRASVADNEAQANAASFEGTISSNGQFVAFTSSATNLIGATDVNAVDDIYVRDLTGNTTILVSRANGLAGTLANGASRQASISDNGNIIAFVSNATNLVGVDPNGTTADIYVRNVSAGTTIRIAGAGLSGDSLAPSISANGQFVVFRNNGAAWVYDVTNDKLTLASGGANGAAISGDGSIVAFESGAALTPTDVNGFEDVYTAPVNFNSAPVNANTGNRALTEDTTFLFASSPLTVSDVDAGSILTVTLSVGQGVLAATNGGGGASVSGGGLSLQISGSATQVNTALATLSYAPATDANGTVQLTMTTSDNAFVTGTDTDIVNLVIAPVNDAPTLTGLAANVAFAQAAVNAPGGQVIDNDVVFTDVDNSFNGGTLVVSGLLASEDVVSIRDEGGGPGNIDVQGSNIFYGATLIGSFAGGTGSNLTVTFGAGATSAAVDALIQNLTYANTNSGAPTPDRTLTLNINDGSGGSLVGGAQSVTVHINAANLLPSGTDVSLNDGREDVPYIITTATFTAGYSDPDGGAASFAGVKINSLPSAAVGILYFDADGDGDPSNAVAVTPNQLISKADLDAGRLVFLSASNASGTASFLFAVQDTAGGFDDTPNQFSLVVNAVNDAPTSGGFEGDIATFTEGQSGGTMLDVGQDGTLADIDSNDFDTGTLTVAITGATSTEAIVIEAGGNVSLSGNDVLVGALTVGTFSGGTGGTPLVITMTSDATPAAMQEVLHALSYTNSDGVNLASGTRDIIVTITDGDGVALGGADTLTLHSQIAITAVPNEPAGADVSRTTPEDTAYVFLTTDFGFTDTDGGTLANVIISTTPTNGQLLYFGSSVSPGQSIPATDIANGQLTYQPNANLSDTNPGGPPPFDSFTFAVQDDGDISGGGANTDQTPNTFTFAVTAVNDPPTVTTSSGTQITPEDTPVVLTGISISDVDADPATAQMVVTLHVAHGVLTVATGVSGGVGSAAITGNGTADVVIAGTQDQINATFADAAGLTYSPNLNYNQFSGFGLNDVLSIKVNDQGASGQDPGAAGSGGTGTATNEEGTASLNIRVTPVDDTPVVPDTQPTVPGIVLTSVALLPGLTFSDLEVDALNGGSGDYGAAHAQFTVARTGGANAQDTFSIVDGSFYTVNGNSVDDSFGNQIAFFNSTGGTLTIFFRDDTFVTKAMAAEILHSIYYMNNSATPPASVELTYTLIDGAPNGQQGAFAAGGDRDSGTVTVSFVVDMPPVATADSYSTNEDTVLNVPAPGVLANDMDADGGTKTVVSVNGNVANVGVPVALTSGAKVTLLADGTLTYDPNHAFDTLTNPSGGEINAVNTSATDQFTYALNGGSSTTVTVTINGVANAADHLDGDSGDNVITGTPNGDYIDLSQGGNDTAFGLGNSDGYYFGAAYTSADVINDSGGTNDQIGLKGDYSGGVTLGTITGIEAIVVLPGFSYNITTVDANVTPGGILKVQATQLAAGQSLTFNGAAEHDGSFLIFGGNGNDNLTGGDGNDGFYFGPNQFDGSDTINGGPGTNDQLGLDGDYAITLGGNLTGIEVIVLLRGPTATPNHFNVTAADTLVAAGQTMTIFGLQVTTDITFNGSGEHDGAFKIYGGSGNDSFTGSDGSDWIFGGGGGDTMTGGAGADTFYYDAASQSTSLTYDKIVGFDDSADTIDLPFAVTGFATPASGNLSTASFDSDLANAFTGLTSHQAGMFTATGGTLSGHTFLVIDADGNAGYQAGSDYVIEIASPVTPIDNPAIFV